MPELDLDLLNQAPTWVTILIIVALSLSLIVGLPLARRAATKAARLALQDAATGPRRNREKVAMIAALAPTVLVWLAVMGVSFIGLTGFAADTMQWRHWTNLLVPLSLDGISISFGGWAFVAVKRGRHPGRSYRIVLAAAAVSATLNFVHGKDEWSLWAGGYLAFLSLAGMAMFHEMLEQFMADYDDEIALKTRYPRFGRRWLWAPISTLKALRAWIVYPPTEDTRATVPNALSHWRHIALLSRGERLEQYDQDALHGRQERAAEQGGYTDSRSHPNDPKPVPTAHHEPGGEELGEGPIAKAAHHNSGNDQHQGVIQRRRQNPNGQEGMTNIQINTLAEDLWIEFMRQGLDLSGSKLLTEFHQRYPYRRGQRWADYRRRAAQTRLTSSGATVAGARAT